MLLGDPRSHSTGSTWGTRKTTSGVTCGNVIMLGGVSMAHAYGKGVAPTPF